MNRLAIVAQLKADSSDRAHELLAAGPPFRLEGSGIERHAVYLSSREVVFVFEGPEVEWKVDDLVDDFCSRPFTVRRGVRRPRGKPAWRTRLF
jgi:hypothetical protein